MHNKLVEHILKYSDHDGIDENELVVPLDKNDNMSQIFEKIYYECRLKPLFEQVLKEMGEVRHNSLSRPINDMTVIDEHSSIIELEKYVSDLLIKSDKPESPLQPHFNISDLRSRKVAQVHFYPDGKAFVVFQNGRTGNFRELWLSAFSSGLSKKFNQEQKQAIIDTVKNYCGQKTFSLDLTPKQQKLTFVQKLINLFSGLFM